MKLLEMLLKNNYDLFKTFINNSYPEKLENKIVDQDISLINGTVFDHYENGMIKLLIEFENGVKNGEFKKWYSNGQLIFSGNFIKDIKNGVFEEYDIYGKKLSKIKYKEGIILWEKDYSEKYQ